MNGRKSKERRRLTEANLRHAVNVNYRAATALHAGFVSMMLHNLFSQIAMGALLQHLDNEAVKHAGLEEGAALDCAVRDIEKAVLFVPPEGERGPQI